MLTLGIFDLLAPDEPVDTGKPIRLYPTPPEYMMQNMTVFGQGWHESTQRFLGKVERLVSHNASVLDFGSGTGILAIAVARLGAAVTACENNPIALKLCRENVALNGVAVECVEVIPSGATYDLIFANVGGMADEYDWRQTWLRALKPGGKLILLDEEVDG
jgi:ribosomal protein L11 methylase PrmA